MKNNRTGTDPVQWVLRREDQPQDPAKHVLSEVLYNEVPVEPQPAPLQVITEVPQVANIEPIIEVKNIKTT